MAMPRFDGSEDAYWWLIQFCQYLEALKFREESWLSIVPLALDGEARSWFLSWRKTNQNVAFFSFEKALMIKFKPEFGDYFPDSEKEEESEDQEQHQEKVQELLEWCNSQVWSKQNVDLALKMKGIAIKRRKKMRVRTWGYVFLANLGTIKETVFAESWVLRKPENSLSPTERTGARVSLEKEKFWVYNTCIPPSPPKPSEPPNNGSLAVTVATQEEEEKEGNSAKEASKREESATISNWWDSGGSNGPLLSPESPDAVQRAAVLDGSQRFAAAVFIACEKKKKIRPASEFMRLGQALMNQAHVRVKLFKPITIDHVQAHVGYVLCKRIKKLTKWVAAKSIAVSGSLSFQQWDPGGNAKEELCCSCNN